MGKRDIYSMCLNCYYWWSYICLVFFEKIKMIELRERLVLLIPSSAITAFIAIVIVAAVIAGIVALVCFIVGGILAILATVAIIAIIGAIIFAALGG